MHSKSWWIGIFPFFLALLISLTFVEFLSYQDTLEVLEEKVSPIEEFSSDLSKPNFYIPERKNCVPADSNLKYRHLKYERKNTKEIPNSANLINHLTYLNLRKDELKEELKNNLSDESKNRVIKELIEIEIKIRDLMTLEVPKNSDLFYIEKCFEK